MPELIAAVEPSTVQIRGKNAPSDESVGTGTGWVLDAEQGLVVTNAHVVNAFPLMVVAVGDDERSAEIVGVAPCEDLAVLRLRDTEGLVTLPLGSQSRLVLGETVVALGFPVNAALGDDLTATTGVVSVVQTEWSIPSLDVPLLTNVVQTDAVINPGNSGGPLVTLEGELVGVNSAGLTQFGNRPIQGQGYSIGVDRVREVDRQPARGALARLDRCRLVVSRPRRRHDARSVCPRTSRGCSSRTPCPARPRRRPAWVGSRCSSSRSTASRSTARFAATATPSREPRAATPSR